MEEIKCFGCGAIIQNEDTKKIGYVPKNAMDNEHILCQRCFKLMHYHQKIESNLSEDDFLNILQNIGEKDALIVYIIDLFDFNGSIITGLMRHIQNNDVLVLANKRDVLPKSLKDHRLNQWVRRQLKKEGIRCLDVILTSGKKNMNYDEIYDSIDEYRHGRDVYVVGVTNVGKSTFINGLLKHYSEVSQTITVSEFPGTTLNLIQIPLDESSFLYDSPGIMNKHQMTSIVSDEQLKIIIPQNEVRPTTYQIENGQSLYFDGFARMDYLTGDKQSFTCYFSRNIIIHRTKTINADELYNRNKTLKNRIEGIDTIDKLKTYEFKLPYDKCDIVISGLGFININAKGEIIQIKVPQNIDVIIRESLM